MHTYPIMLGDQHVGEAEVFRQGMFYRISCRCSAAEALGKRLTVQGDKEADLGLCVPMEGGVGLNTGIAVKHVGEGPLCFDLTVEASAGKFIPVRADAPFDKLDQILNSVLAIRGECIGVLLDQRSMDKPTGQ